jgi:hypothetical protein
MEVRDQQSYEHYNPTASNIHPNQQDLHGTKISPAAFHGTTPVLFNFSCLPAEVRINIYEEITADNDDGIVSALSDLGQHTGLAMSCKQVKGELEHESLKKINNAVAEATTAW